MSSSNICYFGTSLSSNLIQPQFVGSWALTLLSPSLHSHPACRHARRVCSKSPFLETGRQRRFGSASRMECSIRSESKFIVFCIRVIHLKYESFYYVHLLSRNINRLVAQFFENLGNFQIVFRSHPSVPKFWLAMPIEAWYSVTSRECVKNGNALHTSSR